jgi:hypothetical protein
MGGCTFTTEARGKTLREAYGNAVQDALYEYGHDPYNGSISTTDGAVDISDCFPKGIRAATKRDLCERALNYMPKGEAHWDKKKNEYAYEDPDKQWALKGLSPLHRSIVKAIARKGQPMISDGMWSRSRVDEEASPFPKWGPCGAYRGKGNLWYFFGVAAC